MIIKVDYGRKSPGEDHGLAVVSKLIDCDEIIVSEASGEWGFTAYKDDKNIGNYKFLIKQKVVAYVMVDGKTVDKLPRR